MLHHPKCMVNGYIGLMGDGFEEPPIEAGYRRVHSGEMNLWEAPTFLNDHQFVFPEATTPGYGNVFCVGLFNAEQAGELLYIWPLHEEVDVHEGVVPGLINGKLLRGIDVSAEVVAKLEEAIAATKDGI